MTLMYLHMYTLTYTFSDLEFQFLFLNLTQVGRKQWLETENNSIAKLKMIPQSTSWGDISPNLH